MKTNYDIIVVGGGPAGSMAAWEIAKAGLSVCLLEKDRDIGYPVRCGEAVSHNGLSQFVEPHEKWIASRINKFRLVSPSGTQIDANLTNETGYVLNRRIFDYDLSKFAANAGAEIYTKSFVKNLIIEEGFVRGVIVDILGEEKVLKSSMVVGADGVTSAIGRMAGLRTQIRMKDMESCVQYTVANVDVDPNRLDFYMGTNCAPGGYLWVFSKGDRTANIGIGISGKYSKEKSAQSFLNDFMKDKYPQASILTTMCGGVPCSKPMKDPFTDGLILVGDAAHHVNPMTGGGIVSGMKAGQIGGQVSAEAIKQGDASKKFLKKYSDKIRKDFCNRHDRLYKIKEMTTNLPDADLDAIARKVEQIPIENRSLTNIFKAAVFRKPSLIVDVVKVFAGI